MAEINLDAKLKEELVTTLKQYLTDEFDIQLGNFDAQFLLEFFEHQFACHYYNQGLADALQAFEGKVGEVADLVYELEQRPSTSD